MKTKLTINYIINAASFFVLGLAFWLPFLFTDEEIARNVEKFWGSIW